MKGVFALLLLIHATHAQTVRTQNGSIVFEAFGASLTLGPSNLANSTSNETTTTFVSHTDLLAAIAGSVSQTQPQVKINLLHAWRCLISCFFVTLLMLYVSRVSAMILTSCVNHLSRCCMHACMHACTHSFWYYYYFHLIIADKQRGGRNKHKRTVSVL